MIFPRVFRPTNARWPQKLNMQHRELLEKVRESQLFLQLPIHVVYHFLLINTRKESIYISVSILHILTNISSESRPQCYGKVAPSSDVPPVCLFFDPGRRAGLPARSGKSRTLTTCDGDSFRKAHLLLLLHIRLTMACRTLSLPISLSSLRVSILNQF